MVWVETSVFWVARVSGNPSKSHLSKSRELSQRLHVAASAPEVPMPTLYIINTHTHIYIYIYIYIQREVCLYVYIYMCILISPYKAPINQQGFLMKGPSDSHHTHLLLGSLLWLRSLGTQWSPVAFKGFRSLISRTSRVPNSTPGVGSLKPRGSRCLAFF